ncbi:MAG TPA: hypothetical protein VHC92_12740 [Rhodanobacteraceae bacterium]|jgi:predicted transcriptional regulator|nr:hypothetical protein [Rhodanobacteraceae bacterium]
MAAVFKQEAHQLIDQLPETATWDDLIYRAVVCKEIEAGLKDSAAGRVTPVDEVLREFDLAP